MAAGYEHQKKFLAELQKAKEELQRANTKLLSENETRNLTTMKLDNTVSSLNDKLEEQTRRYNQMYESCDSVL
jgi:predicted nuclease with TOPRIM domain